MPQFISPESWVQSREMFVFRVYPAANMERWTFCVSRSTLEELEPQSPSSVAEVFRRCRPEIHRAALRRTSRGAQDADQVLSAQEIRDAR